MSGGGGSSGSEETRDTSSVSTTLAPVNTEALLMRTPTTTTYTPQITNTDRGYYVPPSVIYANMFGQHPGYTVATTPRSNYDPARALAMAEQQRAYQNRSAAELATGYNQSINALAGQREAIIAKQKADAEAAAAAARAQQFTTFGRLFNRGGVNPMQPSDELSTSTNNGIISLLGRNQ